MLIILLSLIFFPLIFGIITVLISKKFPHIREWMSISIMIIEIIGVISLLLLFLQKGKTYYFIPYLCGLGLSFQVDGFRIIYAFLSIFLWLMTIIFSKEYMRHYANKDRYYFFYLLTLSGVVGVFFSGDFMTTFIFFEIMSLSSYPLVIHDEKEPSMKAGETYLGIAIITGMILLMGIFMLYSQTKTLSFSEIKSFIQENGINEIIFIGGVLMLLGFGAKAGMFPLHIWLPKAHPVAPAPASALLSGILTKTGVYGIIILSTNIFFANVKFAYLLLFFAVITMFLGAILALFSIDIKRTLACSSMSQIGFILVGISFMILMNEEGILAIEGAMLHMVNHSLIKLVLFMSAGVFAMNLHTLDLNSCRGFGRKKPFLMIIFLIGALGIMGVPLFNGYVSKTMIHESIVEFINLNHLEGSQLFIFKLIEWIFLISGGLTVAYMSKLFICLFVERNIDEKIQKEFDEKKNYLSPLSKIVFIISVTLLPVIGLLPNYVGINIANLGADFYCLNPLSHRINFFSWECLKGGLISILIGVIIYLGVVRTLLIKNNKYRNIWPSIIDLEYLIYRPIFFKYLLLINLYIFKVIALTTDYIIYFINRTILKPKAYKYVDHTLSYKIGSLIDKVKHNEKHLYAEKNESLIHEIKDSISVHTSTFSFALAMICVGIIVILSLAVLL